MSGPVIAACILPCLGMVSWGQTVSTQAPQSPTIPATGEEARNNPNGTCLMPADVMRWQDYHGPLHTLVTRFTGRLERRTFYSPHFKPGTVLCSLSFTGKLRLYGQDLVDPGYYVPLAFNTGIDQWQNNNPTFGRGGKAYAHRFGANFAAQASADFLSGVFFPTIFGEDPRYYRLARGSAGRRILHALVHIVIAHDDNGNRMPNFSEWFGTSSSLAVNTVYHPGALHGFGSAAQQGLTVIASDAAFDVLREFWPEVARTLKLPFRPVQPITTPGPATTSPKPAP